MLNKIKRFFKSKLNISMMVSLIAGIALLFFSFLDQIIFIVSMGCLIIFGILLCISTFKSYQKNRDFVEEDGTFDATQFDFDEDVYQTEESVRKKLFKKRKKGKMDALAPFVLSILLTVLIGVFLFGTLIF